jgi:hypothetical protein
VVGSLKDVTADGPVAWHGIAFQKTPHGHGSARPWKRNEWIGSGLVDCLMDRLSKRVHAAPRLGSWSNLHSGTALLLQRLRVQRLYSLHVLLSIIICDVKLDTRRNELDGLVIPSQASSRHPDLGADRLHCSR